MLYTPAFRFPVCKPTGAKLALKHFHVWGVRVRLQVAHRIRDLALFDLALDSKLRGYDLQETNGLLTADREPKFDPERLRALNGRPSRAAPSEILDSFIKQVVELRREKRGLE